MQILAFKNMTVVWKLPGGYVYQLETENPPSICLLPKNSKIWLMFLVLSLRNVKRVTFLRELGRITAENKQSDLPVFSCEQNSEP